MSRRQKSSAALACGKPAPEPDRTQAFSELSDNVERDGCVDDAHAVAGDGAVSFESARNELRLQRAVGQASQPFFYERGFDAGPLTAVVGDHLLPFSRYRGLFSTRVAAPATALDATIPFGGLPVGLLLSEGAATVLVIDPVGRACADVLPQELRELALQLGPAAHEA